MDTNFLWTIQNQFALGEIYRAKKYQICLQKNRNEKERARRARNIPPHKWIKKD